MPTLLIRKTLLLGALVLPGIGLPAAPVDPAADPIVRLENLRQSLVERFSVPVESWRRLATAQDGFERVDVDDQAWLPTALGAAWPEDHAWLRARVVLPETVGGQPVRGVPVRLELGVGTEGELFVNGQQREWFHWNAKTSEGISYTLATEARPGAVYQFALACVSPKKSGQLHFARLFFDVLPGLDRYCDEVKFFQLLLGAAPADQANRIRATLAASEALITFSAVTPADLDLLRDEVRAARAALAPLAAITRHYEISYVGHSHIDMNWLWTWEETIDVCHRTWNSTMNLMDEFPDFHFVQSQPAAYVPIEQMYPEQFARIRQKVKDGQWDLVGGMWNESDDNMPGGEALVRSLLLGQNYFEEKFGRFAVTGWLPDSFGHNAQLPQLLQLSGLRYFYHARCANGLDFTWWQGLDGSRVLKANSYNSYDATVNVDQLVQPWTNEQKLGVPQSLVVFGVGDHGGGATREQILTAKNYQNDPILPRLHFVGADAFFAQLAQSPAAAALPVIESDLEYFDEGCYTTHADIKKAVRGLENDLYTAETLSSLAALAGHPADSRALAEAWKPLAFAQFHDIMAGSAIHSTYDWMHAQLAPAVETAARETRRALSALSGSGGPAILVWNSLSFPRDDIVRLPLPDASRYHSVTDQAGHAYPAQAASDGTLVFIARAVPGFGAGRYLPSVEFCAPDGLDVRESPEAFDFETSTLRLRVDRTTGALRQFFLKTANWELFDGDSAANAWQILGESGNAWHIRYTGESQILVGGARVSMVESGPVFARLRIEHDAGASHFAQELTVYGALPRVDIRAEVDWREKQRMAKIRLPLNVTHPVVEAEIPFGSIARPANGQESPMQKWADVSEVVATPVANGTPLDLASFFNATSGEVFEGPAGAGRQMLGPQKIPFQVAAASPGRPDHLVMAAQRIILPPGSGGKTLYLLGASSGGSHWSALTFQLADGRLAARAFALNDWKHYTYPDISGGMHDQTTWSFADNVPGWSAPAGSPGTSPPTLWIVPVPIPAGAKEVRFPNDPQIHLAAATVATPVRPPALCGLSILNNGKYGFDVTGNVFRLTALRSTDKPDPTPELPAQNFTYSLYPHAGGWREAQTARQALALNIPLCAVAASAASMPSLPPLVLRDHGGQGDLIATTFKTATDGQGSILRFYESQGLDTMAQIDFDRPVEVSETDLLERPMARHPLSLSRRSVSLPVGHNQIITLRIIPRDHEEKSTAR